MTKQQPLVQPLQDAAAEATVNLMANLSPSLSLFGETKSQEWASNCPKLGDIPARGFWRTMRWRIVKGSGPGNCQVSTQWKFLPKEMWRYKCRYLLGSQPPFVQLSFYWWRRFREVIQWLCVMSPGSQPHVHSPTQNPIIFKIISCSQL